jgi:hypothetical protein
MSQQVSGRVRGIRLDCIGLQSVFLRRMLLFELSGILKILVLRLPPLQQLFLILAFPELVSVLLISLLFLKLSSFFSRLLFRFPTDPNLSVCFSCVHNNDRQSRKIS